MTRDTAVADVERAQAPEWVGALVGSPHSQADSDLTGEREQIVAKLRRETLDRTAIFIGTGTCGLGAGAGKTAASIREYLMGREIDADVVEVGCIGLCAVEPIVEVQHPGKKRVAFEHVTHDKVESLLDAVFDEHAPRNMALVQHGSDEQESWEGIPTFEEHPFFAPQTRRLLVSCGIIDPDSIDEYIAHGGYAALGATLAGSTPDEVCDEVLEAGLRGRGGGGFPAAQKWKFARSTPAEQKYLICNADEGDPGAFMDRAVIEGDPHRLVEGMAIAAYAIGATKAYVYIRAEYPLAIKRLRKAIEDAKSYGLLGRNILDSGFDLDIIIKMGAGAFVCGEETALMHSVEGKRGMPRPRPPYPTDSGLFGKPTVINNVETLANIPALIVNGSEWFNGVGEGKSRGTKVFALSGKVVNTGLVEVAMGVTLRQVVFDVGGGIPNGKKYKAVQIGGPSGGCIPEQHLDIQITYESLKEVGAIMGSGGLVVMDEDTCMVDIARYFMDFIQRESCGKCIPCREGTRRMLETLEAITEGRGAEKGYDALERFHGVMYMDRLAGVIKDTSLCGLGQTAPNPILSTLRWFRDEYEEHIFQRKCRAGVCQGLKTYSILADVCRGCTVCKKVCPVGAISGDRKEPHTIDHSICIACGACLEACRFEAVVAE